MNKELTVFKVHINKYSLFIPHAVLTKLCTQRLGLIWPSVSFYEKLAGQTAFVPDIIMVKGHCTDKHQWSVS